MGNLEELRTMGGLIAGLWSPFELRLVAVEACAVVCAGWLALWRPEFAASVRRRAWESISRTAQHRIFAVALCAGLVLVLRSAVLPWYGAPVPGVHDEFSYLLGADTFASGRLTNPPHPMWQHFETFHVNQVPSYASIYPPAQAAFLAMGKVMFGHPWAGVVLSSAAMAAAVCWMLQAWMPPQWALLGGILMVLRLGTFGYWINSYWGGNAAALGGALVLGALPRMRRNPTLALTAILCAGIFILANSRPFEGAVFCLPVMIALVVWRRKGDPRGQPLTAAFALMLAAGALLTGYYFWRVTGSPFVMPHQLNQKMYAMSSPFPWQPAPAPPVYRHAVMARLYHEYWVTYESARSLAGFARRLGGKAARFAAFYTGPIFWASLIALPWIVRNRKLRLLTWVCSAEAAAVIATTYFLPHYAAPAVAALGALGVTGIRYLRTWRFRGRPTGLLLTDALLAIGFSALMVRAAGPPVEPAWTVERANLDRSLRSSGTRHLIIVRYAENHITHNEWVYNDADIDGSPVVWARDMGSDENRKLIEYFKNRSVWLLEPDRKPVGLVCYDPGGGER